MPAGATLSDVFRIYNRIMVTDLEIEKVFPLEDGVQVVLNRPLHGEEKRRLDELQNDIDVGARVRVEKVRLGVGSEDAADVLDGQPVPGATLMVKLHGIEIELAADAAERAIDRVQALLDTLNAERREREKGAREEQRKRTMRAEIAKGIKNWWTKHGR